MSFASMQSASTLEKDYYKILSLPYTATPEQIKDQYRALAKKHHPDVRISDPTVVHEPNADKFRDVAEAY
jgi:DnaJ-class molecular chaperone